MDDQQEKKENTESIRTAFDSSIRTPTTADLLLEKAKQDRDFLIKENARMERNIESLKELEAVRLLSGTAGGRTNEVPTEEEMRRKQAMDFWKGTSIADAISKVK